MQKLRNGLVPREFLIWPCVIGDARCLREKQHGQLDFKYSNVEGRQEGAEERAGGVGYIALTESYSGR